MQLILIRNPVSWDICDRIRGFDNMGKCDRLFLNKPDLLKD
ncbi:hypothetical protein [Planktothrix tepida]|nr:hypothetical protein [Planktothrix tepida]